MSLAQHTEKDPKAITGRTVLFWLFGFFGVVFLANGIFIYFALGSFPGVAVDSAYQAGQAYNREIAAARSQADLDWQVSSLLETGGMLIVRATDRDGAPLYGLRVTAVLRHPAHEAGDIEAEFRGEGGGRYVAELGRLPKGNWDLVLEIEQNGVRKFKSENRIFVGN